MKAIAASGEPLSKFLNLGAQPTVLAMRDASEFIQRPAGTSNTTIETPSGRHKVTVQDFIAATKSLSPDVVVAMSNEVNVNVDVCSSFSELGVCDLERQETRQQRDGGALFALLLFLLAVVVGFSFAFI